MRGRSSGIIHEAGAEQEGAGREGGGDGESVLELLTEIERVLG